MLKKVISMFVVLLLAFASMGLQTSAASLSPQNVETNNLPAPAPIGGGNTIPTFTTTYYVSNTDLGMGSAGALSIERLLKRQAGARAFGLAGAAAGVAAAVNHFSGKNGYTVTVTYRYKLYRANFHSQPTKEWVAEKWSIGTY